MTASLYGEKDEFGDVTSLSAQARERVSWWRMLPQAERSAWRSRATCGLYGCAECRPDRIVKERASWTDTIEWAYPRRLIGAASCQS